MKTLDPFAISFSGLNLIEASAGTGKTYNITSLYVRAIIEQGRSVDQILVVTYTKAATKELRERLLKRLRFSLQALNGQVLEDDDFLHDLSDQVHDIPSATQKIKQAIHSFDEAAVFTIHGFCQHILQSRAFESSTLFEADLIENDEEVAEQLIDDYWRRWVGEAAADENVRPLLKYLVDKGIHPDALKKELSSYIEKPYVRLLPEIEPSLVDFKKKIAHLRPIYKRMQATWEGQQEQIKKLLLCDQMSGTYYRKGWLEGWIPQMDRWLQQEVLPLKLAEKIDKFRQSRINQSTTKKSTKAAPEHPFFKAADQYAEDVEDVQSFDIFFKMRLLNHLKSNIEEKKEQLRVFSYDDLLIKLKDALTDERYGRRLQQILRTTYPVAMVDEFQDTDPIQYQIFKSIYSPHQSAGDAVLFMIGDPKQSIYSFRGADIFTYLKAREDTPDENIYGLDRNFRSIPDLIEATNTLFQRQEHPFILQDIPFYPVQAGRKEYDQLIINKQQAAPIKIQDLAARKEDLPLKKGVAQEHAAGDTAWQISELLHQATQGEALIGDRNVKAGDIAVIVRTHRQAEMISEALKDRHLKSVRYSQASVFKSEEAQQLQHVLQAVATPGDEGLVMAALATDMMGYHAEDLMQLEQDEQQWSDILDQFNRWNERWQQQGIVAMFGAMMQKQHVDEHLIKLVHGERKCTNLNHLIELLQQQEQTGRVVMPSLLRWFAKKMQDDRKTADAEQLRLESDENLVKIVTMHRSKGLEYPIVFCPFLWKGPRWSDSGKALKFHDKSAAYLDFNGKDDPARSQKRLQSLTEVFAESLRLAYVAITRAKYQCNISWLQAKKSEFSPLGYLLLGEKKVFAILENMLSDSGKYKPVDAEVFSEAWRDILEQYSKLFAMVKPASHEIQSWSDRDDASPDFKNRTFSRKKTLKAGHAIGSFSSLVRNEHEDYDEAYDFYFDEFDTVDDQPKVKDENVFINFPKGPNPGTAIHHIFENIYFQNDEHWREIIADQLSQESIDLKWIEAVAKMLQTTVHKSLLTSTPALTLEAIKTTQCIPELEFYFRSGSIQLRQLLQIIRPQGDLTYISHGFSKSGFLKGFIDLTFCFNHRFYIVDYKTNYLGDARDAYKLSNLKKEMQTSFYDVQYHLYSLALHRFLMQNLKDYNYEDHFGGVFYLFLRGIHSEGQEGIFADRPARERMEKLDHYLQREEHAEL